MPLHIGSLILNGMSGAVRLNGLRRRPTVRPFLLVHQNGPATKTQ
jgi:hypothetical protein